MPTHHAAANPTALVCSDSRPGTRPEGADRVAFRSVGQPRRVIAGELAAVPAKMSARINE